MDPMSEEQLDYGDEEYGSQKVQYQGGGTIPALAEEELMGEDDEYDDLYNDVNVGEGFMQMQQSKAPPSVGGVNGGLATARTEVSGSRVPEADPSPQVKVPGVGQGSGEYSNGVQQTGRSMEIALNAQVGNSGFQGSAPMLPKHGGDLNQMQGKFPTSSPLLSDPVTDGSRTTSQMPINRVPVNRPVVGENPSRPAAENGATMLFVGELHWWTTDAELEGVLSQYGRVKEIKFFDERASGKSKGYCQVEFYESGAAAACKEGMNGYVFNGRACVVTFASPQSLKQMGASYMNKTPVQAQTQPQGRRVMNDSGGRGGGTNFPSGADNGRNFGKVGWGRGGQGMLSRGQMGGMVRGRGAIGANNIMGNTGGIGGGAAIGGNPFGQGIGGPAMGGPAGGLMHPQNMMGVGFDPTYMGRGGGYGGFAGPAFPGMMPQFPGFNAMALPGVAPHVNPAFFARGVSANAMGMMGSTGMEGQHPGMWSNPMMGGWGGEEQGRRTRESSYAGDDGASNYGYGDASQERGGKSNPAPTRERPPERDLSGNSERRHNDEREQEWDRSDRDARYRDEKNGHREQRQRERDLDNEEDWDRGQPTSRSRSKSYMMQEEDHRSRSRDADYGKRRRLPSE